MVDGKKNRLYPIILSVLAQTETVAVIQSNWDFSVGGTAESRYQFRVHPGCCDAVGWSAGRKWFVNIG